jgi:hypothetical protein
MSWNTASAEREGFTAALNQLPSTSSAFRR